MASQVFGFARRRGEEAVYDEEAFRHFLDVERARAAHANRSLLLLLVSLRPRAGSDGVMPRSVALAVFSGLGLSVREVDFLGWFREGRVAAAVLVQRGATDQDVARQIGERVTRALDGELPGKMAERLRVRVLHLRGRD